MEKEHSDGNVRIARRILIPMLIPAVVYPFSIPFTPYWADMLYVTYCVFLFFVARIAKVLPLTQVTKEKR